MPLDPGAIAVLLVFAAMQTGALIFFAGAVTVTLRNHSERLNENEAKCEDCSRAIVRLVAREEFEL